MTKIETATVTDFVTAARTAYDEADAARNSELEQERVTQIIHIGKHLADRGITPVGDPFTNRASGRVCVPIVRGGWDEETETQIHAVAVEWDGEAAELGMPLVADGDLEDYGFDTKELLPAGRLTGLVDVGRAIANGGRAYVPPPTAANRVGAILSTALASSDDASGIQTCLEALCTAVLDVADAIRETRTGA